MAKGAGKGQEHERRVCKALSLWVSGGVEKHIFWRSSQSGGRATTLRKRGEQLSRQAGDIAAIDPAGELFCETFFVEIKFVKTLRLDLLAYPDVQGVLGPFWRKCIEQASWYHKVPLMIVKENAHPWLVGMSRQMTSQTVWPPLLWCNNLDLCLVSWEDFIQWKDAWNIIVAAQEHRDIWL